MSDWPTVTLKDSGVELIDCDHKTPKAKENGMPYVGIPQLRDGRITLDGARLISEEDFHTWRRKTKPTTNDVVLSRRCNPGETAYVPEGLEIALGQNLVLLRSNGEKLYPPFLRWVVKGPYWWNQVGKFINVGAVFDSLKCADIPKFKIKLPPMESQIEISKILGALESKIELNQNMNKTLEAIAQAIFKRWFIDFEFPDENGNPYKSSGGKMTNTEYGDIPKEWELKTIDDVVSIKGGTTPSTKNPEYWDGDICWCTPKDLSNLNSPVLLDTERKITETGLRTISSGLLEKGVLLLSSRAPIGYLAISEVPVSINQGFIAIICDKMVSNYFMYFWSKVNLPLIESMASGSTFQEINKANFRKIRFFLPAENLLTQFNNIVSNLWSTIVHNERQTRALMNIRDSLLPRLMSGKIRVKVDA